jgi:hypothetical protein
MGLIRHFAAREVGRAFSQGERRSMASHRRSMELSDVAMAISAAEFFAKIESRSVIGHPEFLQDEAAEKDRWWGAIRSWAEVTFDIAFVAIFSGIIAFLSLVVVVLLRPETSGVGPGFLALVVFGLTQHLLTSHLWRPVVRWSNWRFKRAGWPVERMLADLKRNEGAAERLADHEAATAARRPLRPVRYRTEDQIDDMAMALRTELSTSLAALRAIRDLVDAAESTDPLDHCAFAKDALEAASLVLTREVDAEPPASEREIDNVARAVIDTAGQTIRSEASDVTELANMLLLLRMLLSERRD